jgi:four helix bundle protein
MSVFDHEKMVVYQKARTFLAIAYALIRQLPRGNADVADQLGRGARSVMFNIAEGAGRRMKGEKAKFYDYASGSTTECASALDAIAVGELGPREQLEKGRELLIEIVKMLTVLVKRMRERDE